MRLERIKSTLPALLAQSALLYPDHPALIHRTAEVRLTYRHFSAEVMAAARGLYGLGLEPGERVVIWGDNAPHWLYTQWAAAHIGAVWVPADPACPPQDLAWLLQHCEAAALVLAQGLGPALSRLPRQALPELVITWPDQSCPAPDPELEIFTWQEMLAEGKDVSPGDMAQLVSQIKPRDLTAIMYTSGTTGRPKGVMLDHQSLLAKNQAAAERMGLGPEDRLALFFPLHHMFGNCCVALTGLISGAALVMPGHRFQPGPVLEAMAEEKCTALFGAPAMMAALLDHPSRREYDLSPLRTGIIGGAPCPLGLLRRVVEELGAAEITIAYGITEAAGWITMTEPHDPLEVRASTLGKPLKGCRVKIVDPDSGRELPPGREGEVCTKGLLMKGYLGMEALTAQVLDAEGWLHTGDQGSLDHEGRLRLSGRRKEVIRTAAGEVFPAEVEEAVYQLPQVAQAAAFGLPAPQGEHELIALWVRLKPEAALSEDEILEHCRRELDPARVPATVRLVEELPTTPSGKIQRHRLRRLAQE